MGTRIPQRLPNLPVLRAERGAEDVLLVVDGSNLRSGNLAQVEFDDIRLLVFQAEPSKVVAYLAICPHLGGPLEEGRRVRGLIRCPWHGYAFDLHTGACHSRGARPWREGLARWGVLKPQQEIPEEPFPVPLKTCPIEKCGPGELRIQIPREGLE